MINENDLKSQEVLFQAVKLCLGSHDDYWFIYVELWSDEGFELRPIMVKKQEWKSLSSENSRLDMIRYLGNNDNQPRDQRSICVGDVIQFGNRRFRIDDVGYTAL